MAFQDIETRFPIGSDVYYVWDAEDGITVGGRIVGYSDTSDVKILVESCNHPSPDFWLVPGKVFLCPPEWLVPANEWHPTYPGVIG